MPLAKIGAAVQATDPLFLSEPKCAAAAASKPAPHPAAPRDFPERQRVLRELREIVRLFDRGRRN